MSNSQFWMLVAFIYASQTIPAPMQLLFAVMAISVAWWMSEK